MQGVFINGQRPKSKVAIKRHLAAQSNDGDGVRIEATSMFGNEYDGPLALADQNLRFSIVGPDPYTSRKFYGTTEHKNGRWTIK